MKHEYDISEHGACPDGKTKSTKAIQQAIDACHRAGGGRVLCGPGRFLTGALTLRSNVELHLTNGCKLVGSPCLEDYEELKVPGFGSFDIPEQCAQSLIHAANAENVAITGSGEINGSGLAFYDLSQTYPNGHLQKPSTPRPRMVMFYECRQVLIEDTSFIDSPCWTFWLMKCQDVNVNRIKIRGDRRMCNIDGIDIDSCRNVAVSNSFFETEDDCLVLRAIRTAYDTPAVCEHVTVSNCVLDSHCNGIRVGGPADGVIRNCTFNNLVIHNDLNNGILFENIRNYMAKDGKTLADVHDIMFSNMVIECAKWPVKIVVEDGIALPRLSGLSFSNLRIKSGNACLVQGSKETTIRDVSFSNVEIATSGEDAIVCRHCQGVKLSQVELSNLPEPRP